MSPTSRNTLMIGGALIAIALLLVCGPLSDRFGSRGSDRQEPPAVAAGPPPDAAGVVGAAAVGALAGATVGEVDVEALVAAGNGDPCRPVIEGESDADRASRLRDHDCLAPAAPEVPEVARVDAGAAEAGGHTGPGDASSTSIGEMAADAAVATTAALAAATSTGTSAGSSGASAVGAGIAAASTEGIGSTSLPAVSAGLRSAGDAAALSSGVGPGGAGAVAATPALAAAAFDDAFASAGTSGSGIRPAGPVVWRFPPPVAALGASPSVLAAAQPFIDSNRPVVLPCDSPGSGCANIRPPSNPPFVPGRRPGSGE